MLLNRRCPMNTHAHSHAPVRPILKALMISVTCGIRKENKTPSTSILLFVFDSCEVLDGAKLLLPCADGAFHHAVALGDPEWRLNGNRLPHAHGRHHPLQGNYAGLLICV